MLRIDRTLQTIKAAMQHTLESIERVWTIEGDFGSYQEALAACYNKHTPNAEPSFKPAAMLTSMLHKGHWTCLPWHLSVADRRYFFGTRVDLPEFDPDYAYFIEVTTGREGQWDAVNPQLLAYINGEVVCGLDTNHNMVMLEGVHSAKAIDLGFHLYTGMQAGDLAIRLSLVKRSHVAFKAYHDLRVLRACIQAMPGSVNQEVGAKTALYNLVQSAIRAVRFSPGDEAFNRGCQALSKHLWASCYGEGNGTFTKHNSSAGLPYTVHAIGHTHIDVAWLWDLRQTREKVARSYATALDLQKRYPHYRFMASQPVLYEMLEVGQPLVFEKVVEASKGELWESEGAMYLEADCNLAGGESLVRQIEYGQAYFESTFGKPSRTLWLPDVFGYSAMLPQLLSGFGIEMFITSKISWNDTNKLPFDSFLWQGVDGTQIPTQFITTISMETLSSGAFKTIYEGNLTPTEVLGGVMRHQQRDQVPHVIMPFGYGDGGGGANEEMLETGARLCAGVMGMPKVVMSSVGDFIEAYKETPIAQLPVWTGELYLEYHRGTYTTNGGIKKRHRALEDALLATEKQAALKVLRGVLNPNDLATKRALDGPWRVLLLNEFHDILPGTSIEQVYLEAYGQLDEAAEVVRSQLVRLLETKAGQPMDFVAVNNHYRRFDGPVWLELDTLLDPNRAYALEFADGHTALPSKCKDPSRPFYVPLQHAYKGRWVTNIPDFLNFAPLAACTFKVIEVHAPLESGQAWGTKELDASVYFETHHYKVTFSKEGQIEKLYDKLSRRSVLIEGGFGHRLIAYEDRPLRWDAWDIDEDYRQFPLEFDPLGEEQPAIQVLAKGPIATIVKVQRSIGNSTIDQHFAFYHGKQLSARRIDCFVEANWQMHQVLLRAELDTQIHANHATYDIQFGQVNRPNDSNHAYSQAMFEVCAQHWGALCDGNYGVMLMSNDKFGYSAKGGALGLSLIKSPTWPNPNSDQGTHSFSYAILPMLNAQSSMALHEAALQYCHRPTIIEGTWSCLEQAAPLKEGLPFEIPENFSLEAMRLRENGIVEVRLVERANRRGTAQILSKHTIEKRTLKGALLSKCEKGQFDYRPYEIVTLYMDCTL